MPVAGSVSQWIAQVKRGDAEALAALHRRYWPNLVNLARGKIRGTPVRSADEEDVAQTAFIAFYNHASAGRLPRLENRHQLLALLSTIIAHDAVNRIKHEFTRKAGGGKVASLSPLEVLVADHEYTPLQEAVLADCYVHYLGLLPDEVRPFAELHLAGFTNEEIGQKLGCVKRTVIRKLNLVRETWQVAAEGSVKLRADHVRAN
jgi:DNA-directed RNA polymerase specialized sigma24 family protein